MEKHVHIHMNAYKPVVEANTAHWRLPVPQWKFPLLLLPSVEASNLLPSVQASICFPFVVEDGITGCEFGEVPGSAWKPVERVLARQSSRDDVDVSGCKWNHMEASGSERSSLEASAEVLLEASTEASNPTEKGSFTLIAWKIPSLPRKLPSYREVNYAAGGSFYESKASSSGRSGSLK